MKFTKVSETIVVGQAICCIGRSSFNINIDNCLCHRFPKMLKIWEESKKIQGSISLYEISSIYFVCTYRSGDFDRSAANGKLHKGCSIMAYCSAALKVSLHSLQQQQNCVPQMR